LITADADDSVWTTNEPRRKRKILCQSPRTC